MTLSIKGWISNFKKHLHFSPKQQILIIVAATQAGVAIANGLDLVQWPRLPSWVTPFLLGVLAILTTLQARRTKSITIWGVDVIVVRGFLISFAGLYPDLTGINHFLNDDYVRTFTYEVSFFMIIMGISKVSVIEENYQEILNKTKPPSLADISVALEAYHRWNPEEVIKLKPATKFIVVEDALNEGLSKEEIYGDTEVGRRGPPLV